MSCRRLGRSLGRREERPCVSVELASEVARRLRRLIGLAPTAVLRPARRGPVSDVGVHERGDLEGHEGDDLRIDLPTGAGSTPAPSEGDEAVVDEAPPRLRRGHVVAVALLLLVGVVGAVVMVVQQRPVSELLPHPTDDTVAGRTAGPSGRPPSASVDEPDGVDRYKPIPSARLS